MNSEINILMYGQTKQLRSYEVNFHPHSHLIHEAMSRARMLKPQDSISEASRPARRIAMNARNTQNRILGNQ
jgi:hypothetical protein